MTVKPMWCWTMLGDLAGSRILPNGDVETELEILELVPQDQVGGAGKFNPAEWVDDAISIFTDEASRGFEPPFVLGHPTKPKTMPDGTVINVPDESVPAVAYLTGMRKVGTRLVAGVRVQKDFAPRLRKRDFRYASPEFRPYYDQTGAYRGIKITRVGVTNMPFQKGADGQAIGQFMLAEIPLDGPIAQPLPHDSGREFTMTDDQIKALLAEESKASEARITATLGETIKAGIAEGLKAATATLAESVKIVTPKPTPDATAALAEVTSLKERLDRAETERTAQAAQIKAFGDGITATAIRETVALGESANKITPGMRDKWFPNLKTDPMGDLEKSPFKSVAALSEYIATAPVQFHGTTRKSLPAADGGALSEADLAAEAKRKGTTPDALKAMRAALAEQDAEMGIGA